MTRVALILLLIAPSWAVADPIYKWVDQEGEHYTNDPATIPPNQKTQVTTGAEIGEITTHRPNAPVEETRVRREAVPREPSTVIEASGDDDQTEQEKREVEQSWRDAFHQARQRISDLETKVAEDKKHAEEVKDMELSTFHGWDGSRRTYSPRKEAQQQLAQDQRELETARGDLQALEHSASDQGIPQAWRRE